MSARELVAPAFSLRRLASLALGWALVTRVVSLLRQGRLARAAATAVVTFLFGTMARGSQHGFLWALLGPLVGRRPRIQVGGHCAPGYERVKAIFERHLQEGRHRGVQCVAFVRGVKVVDLWGCQEHQYRNKTVRYTADSLQNVFSSSKMITSLVVAMLVDRGHL
eukprot:g2481.t1